MGRENGRKSRKTVSLDREVVEQLDDWSDNDSALVNRLLREYFKSGGDGPIGLEVKLRDLEQRIETALNERDRVNRRIERLRDQKTAVEKRIEQRQSTQRERLEEAKRIVDGRDPSNPAVRNWAEKLGMTPTELLHKVKEIEA